MEEATNTVAVTIRDKRQLAGFLKWCERVGLQWINNKPPTESVTDERISHVIITNHSVMQFALPKDNEMVAAEHTVVTPAQYKLSFEEHHALRQIVQMSPRTFRLIADTIELTAGALVQDTGNGYILIEHDHIKSSEQAQAVFGQNYGKIRFTPDVVEQQPEYFEEVFAVAPSFMNAEELQAYRDYTVQQLRHA